MHFLSSNITITTDILRWEIWGGSSVFLDIPWWLTYEKLRLWNRKKCHETTWIGHYIPEQKIVSSLCYLVLIQTGHCMCACVKLYHVITLNTRTLRVTIIKRKFDSKLKNKGSRWPYCEWLCPCVISWILATFHYKVLCSHCYLVSNQTFPLLWSL